MKINNKQTGLIIIYILLTLLVVMNMDKYCFNLMEPAWASVIATPMCFMICFTTIFIKLFDYFKE